MKVTVITGKELSPELLGMWRDLQTSNSDLGSPFFHPHFTTLMSDIRGDVEVALLESGGKLKGFLPFQREHKSVASAVGGIISDYQGVICAPSFEFSPIEILKGAHLRAWDFDHLITSQSCFQPYHWFVEHSPQIDVSRGYEAYVKQRRLAGSEQLKRIEYLERRIEREVGALRFVVDATDTESLSTVLSWKSAQYQRTAKGDLFASGWIRDAVNQLFQTRADGCSGILSLLYAGDQIVAGHFGLRSKQVWHYWFPSYNPALAKHSPGLILLRKMLEHAPMMGLRIIDLGKGLSPYKERFMNSSIPLASGRLERFWRAVPRATWRATRSRLANSSIGSIARFVLRKQPRAPDRVSVL